MPLDDDVLAALRAGLLHSGAAASAIFEILAPYPLGERREIIRLLRTWIAEASIDVLAVPTEPQAVRTVLLSRLWAVEVGAQPPTIAAREIDAHLARSTSAELVSRQELVRVSLETEVVEFPMFQFQQAEREPALLEVRAPVATANRLLLAGTDPWGALSWWVTPNGYLNGRPPAVTVQASITAESVVEAAQELAA